jgi:hypothetical protein
MKNFRKKKVELDATALDVSNVFCSHYLAYLHTNRLSYASVCTYHIQPPYRDYNPIEDAGCLWDHKTCPACTRQACRASTFSTQIGLACFYITRLFIIRLLRSMSYFIEKKHSRNQTTKRQITEKNTNLDNGV